MRATTFFALTLSLLTACSDPGPQFSNMMALEGGGPDASDVQLNDPLVMPSSIALPPPTPGGSNRADPG